MRLSLFMNDDVRENVFRHVEVDQPLNVGAIQSMSVKAKLGNTYSSGFLSRGNTHALGKVTPKSSKGFLLLSPLFSLAHQNESLMPLPIPYSQLTGGCYAEELVDSL